MKPGAMTLSEIYAQPGAWKRCLQMLDEFDFSLLANGKHPHSWEWLFVGCGTSYYLAQAAAASLVELTGAPARAVPASELLLFPQLVIPAKGAPVFPVLISRSGHTSEILEAAEVLRRRKIEFMSITCDGNELVRLSPRTLQLPISEESTVMTSSFTSMLLALQYTSARLSDNDGFIQYLHALPDALAGLLPTYGPRLEQFANRSFDDVAFLAQGALYPIASETALKVMESSSSYAQFFHTLEFRHGPKSIISDKVLVGGLLSESGYAEESAVLLEMKSLGGCTLAIANHITAELRASADLSIELDLPVPEPARLIVYVVWGQLLGAYIGLKHGLNPDSPRHLSRVVTLAG